MNEQDESEWGDQDTPWSRGQRPAERPPVPDRQEPAPGVTVPRPAVPSHLALAVTATVASLCSVFLATAPAIAAVVLASRVDRRLLAGDVVGAQQASRRSLVCSLAAFAITAVVLVLLGVFGDSDGQSTS